MPASSLRTARLLLRPWRDADLEPFALLNADPEVMRYLPKTLGRAESDATAERIRTFLAEHAFGLWAVECPGAAEFIGFVGLSIPRFEAPFTPCIEIGWRLARRHHGRGYATEAAQACLLHGFEVLGLEGVVSFTAAQNAPSRRVMEKLGMRRDPTEDFDHPALPEGHPLRRHVLYRLAREDWPARRGSVGGSDPTRL